jgi:DNA-binding Xre family transcriptional regulator
MSTDMLLVPDDTTEEWAAEGFPATSLRSEQEVTDAFEHFGARRHATVWIVDDASQLIPLAEHGQLLRSNHRLLLLNEATGAQKDLLHLLFRVVVAPGNGVTLLPIDELREVLASDERADLFVGGVIDPATEAVALYRGNLAPVIVPFAWFLRRNPSPKPNFRDFEITDFGQTVRFGRYEASADAVLYAHDRDYRRRAKARRLKHDDSLGACLQRLRLSRGLSRRDFPGVSEKQVARIERGEVTKVRTGTLAALAKRLDVDPAEITSY